MNLARFHLSAALAITLTAGAPALASSDEAWEELRADVAAKCLKASGEMIDEPKAIVDPFGSEHYGLALVSGMAKSTDTHVTHICVYDKQAKTVELGSELTDAAMKGE